MYDKLLKIIEATGYPEVLNEPGKYNTLDFILVIKTNHAAKYVLDLLNDRDKEDRIRSIIDHYSNVSEDVFPILKRDASDLVSIIQTQKVFYVLWDIVNDITQGVYYRKHWYSQWLSVFTGESKPIVGGFH